MIKYIELGKPKEPERYRPELHQLLYQYDKPKEKHNMPIKVIAATEIPQRPTRGNPIPEVAEVLEALKSYKANSALKISLSTETAKRLTTVGKNGKEKNPYQKFANSLKRAFKDGGLNFTAYKSATDDTVIVVSTQKPASTPAPKK